MIRLANKNDLFFILKLHNQNVLDKNFFSKKKINLKDHKIWFDRKIKEKMLFICSFKEKIGYIRYDKIDKKNLSVSIAVKKKFKRKGFGELMLNKTLKKKAISSFNIMAVIKKKNIVSKKFFMNLGFKFYRNNIYIIKSKI